METEPRPNPPHPPPLPWSLSYLDFCTSARAFASRWPAWSVVAPDRTPTDPYPLYLEHLSAINGSVRTDRHDDHDQDSNHEHPDHDLDLDHRAIELDPAGWHPPPHNTYGTGSPTLPPTRRPRSSSTWRTRRGGPWAPRRWSGWWLFPVPSRRKDRYGLLKRKICRWI